MSRWKILVISLIARLVMIALYLLGINSLDPVEPFVWWNWVGVLMLILLMVVGITVVGDFIDRWLVRKVKFLALVIALRKDTKEARKADRKRRRAARKAAKA